MGGTRQESRNRPALCQFVRSDVLKDLAATLASDINVVAPPTAPLGESRDALSVEVLIAPTIVPDVVITSRHNLRHRPPKF